MKRFLALILFALTLFAQVFPGSEWITADPKDQSMSGDGLQVAKEKFEKSGGLAMMVIRNGYLIAAWGDVKRKFDTRSIRKSLLNSIIGIQVSRGKIDLDRNLADLNISDRQVLNLQEKKAQIKNLLSSSSGIYLPASFEQDVHIENKPERGSHQAGEFFYYNNWDFNVLGTIYIKQAGVDLFESFNQEIAKPLQMEDFDYRYDTAYLSQPALSDHPAYLFIMSTRDLARFALLYLNDGNWNGRQLIDKKWIIESSQTQIETSDDYYYNYGYLWWVSKGKNNGRHAFLARGAQSQYLYIDPNTNLIIIFRDNPDATEHVQKRIAYPLIGDIYRSLKR
ncbi:MAG: serine hydrolase [Calditrichaeota bacterium]|nr:serine hydrolase [Calditrichota bacterium]